MEPFNTQVPNIIDDLGLDPFERALYVHYKRVCGNNQGGYSNETVDTIHKKLRMSAGQVSEARKSLAERGLIRVQDTRPVVVTVIDIWNLNKTYYQLEREQRPDIEGWTVEQLQLWLSDFHTVKLDTHNGDNLPSPGETSLTDDNNMSTDIHPVNEKLEQFHTVKLKDNMSTQFHTVKQRRESLNPKESNTPSDSTPNGVGDKSPQVENSRASPAQLMFGALAKVCKINWKIATNDQKGELNQNEKILRVEAEATPGDLPEFEKWWYKSDWRGKGGSPPKPAQVREVWQQFIDYREKTGVQKIVRTEDGGMYV